jgi:hypothetical protein
MYLVVSSGGMSLEYSSLRIKGSSVPPKIGPGICQPFHLVKQILRYPCKFIGPIKSSILFISMLLMMIEG